MKSAVNMESSCMIRKSVIRKKALAAGALLALAAVGSACHAAERLQVATAGAGASDAATAIAIQLGYFRDSGLEVTLFDAGGGNNAVSTVVGGDAQLGIVGIRNASKPVEKGQELKIIATDTQGFLQNIIVRADLLAKGGIGPDATLAQKGALLRNLRIAVNDVGGSSGEFARFALMAAGLGERDATIVNINSSAARLTALKAGRIDAIVATPPEPEIAATGGYGAVLVDPARDLPQLGKIASTVEVVRGDYLRQNPGLLKRYLGAVERGHRLIRSEADRAKAAYFEYLRGASKSNTLAEGVFDASWQAMLPSFSDTLATSAEQYANARRFFNIPVAVTYELFVDNSLAHAVDSNQ
jgi:NitT/TauT family transport system substrate-binding protein